MLAVEGSVSFPFDYANTSRPLCLWLSTIEKKVIDWSTVWYNKIIIWYKGWQGDAEGGEKWFVLVQPGCCHTTQNISANLERKNFVLSPGRGVTLGIRKGNFALSSGSADNCRFSCLTRVNFIVRREQPHDEPICFSSCSFSLIKRTEKFLRHRPPHFHLPVNIGISLRVKYQAAVSATLQHTLFLFTASFTLGVNRLRHTRLPTLWYWVNSLRACMWACACAGALIATDFFASHC